LGGNWNDGSEDYNKIARLEQRVSALTRELEVAQKAHAAVLKVAMEEEAHLAQLREALEKIRDGSAHECQCDHSDEDCCNKQAGGPSYFCAFCVADAALAAAPTKEGT